MESETPPRDIAFYFLVAILSLIHHVNHKELVVTTVLQIIFINVIFEIFFTHDLLPGRVITKVQWKKLFTIHNFIFCQLCYSILNRSKAFLL